MILYWLNHSLQSLHDLQPTNHQSEFHSLSKLQVLVVVTVCTEFTGPCPGLAHWARKVRVTIRDGHSEKKPSFSAFSFRLSLHILGIKITASQSQNAGSNKTQHPQATWALQACPRRHSSSMITGCPSFTTMPFWPLASLIWTDLRLQALQAQQAAIWHPILNSCSQGRGLRSTTTSTQRTSTKW